MVIGCLSLASLSQMCSPTLVGPWPLGSRESCRMLACGPALAASCCANQGMRPAAMTLKGSIYWKPWRGGMAGTQVPLTVLHTWSAVVWYRVTGTWVPAVGLGGGTVVEALAPCQG